jgi:endonuclease YncB( thermonuclease family)
MHVIPHYRFIVFALLSMLQLFPATQAEEVFRWQDSHGQVHYGDEPPETALNTQTLNLSLPRATYYVEKVIDGDTIIVRGGGKVRLLGINAPEIAHRDRRGEPLGEEARKRLTALVEGKRVQLEFDQRRRDRFKRLLAHITLEDGTNVNELLLQEGLARALFLQPNMRYLNRYYDTEKLAQEGKQGIWSLSEFKIKPARKAKQCIKRFCRLHGKVTRVESKRDYIYLHLAGRLRIAIHRDNLEQFHSAGIVPARLKGEVITVRGWIGSRKGNPHLRLQHPQQIIPASE